MQFFAEELPAKSAGERHLLLFPPRGHPSPSLKNTHCPHVAFQKHLSHPGHAFARRHPCHRVRRGGPIPAPYPLPHPAPSQDSVPALATSCLLYFSPSPCHTNHPCSRFAPVVSSNHGFHSPSAWPLLPPLPLPAKPTSSLTSAEPMSMVTF